MFSAWREDGNFKLYLKGSIYPCHTANTVNVLCHMGYAFDAGLQKTFQHLLNTQYTDGSWHCNNFSFSRGLETEYSNPLPTLTVLNAFRFSDYLNKEPALDRSVDFLLEHGTIRKPIGPCHYGIGTLFIQVEYPFHNSRLIMNYQLMSCGFSPISIAKENRLDYYSALDIYATEGILYYFTNMIAELEEMQLDQYISLMPEQNQLQQIQQL